MKSNCLRSSRTRVQNLSGILFLVCFVSLRAWGDPPDPIHFDVTTMNFPTVPFKVGEIDIKEVTQNGGETLSGDFKVTRMNKDGSVMTLAQLEASLGENHLNWFQKVISVTPAIPGVNPPFIDPPKGGDAEFWDDDIPWLWNEVLPPNPLPPGKQAINYPNGLTELQFYTQNGPLHYFDAPGGQPVGTVTNYVTFLISDFGDKTYVPFEGFSWQSKIAADGSTTITQLAAGADFKTEYIDEIKADFKYNAHAFGGPEPSPFFFGTACTFGFLGMVWKYRKRRSRQEH